jgi:hypothetical protein
MSFGFSVKDRCRYCGEMRLDGRCFNKNCPSNNNKNKKKEEENDLPE